MKILVVDDEAPSRQWLIRLLSEIHGNYEIAGEASDGTAAVELCRAKAVDLVLIDAQLPGINGLDAAQEIADIDPPPAVILMSAYEQSALTASQVGVEDYLMKPVRRERLQEALERARIPIRPQPGGLANLNQTHPRRRLSLSAHYRGGLRTVPIEEIIYLQADQKYVTARHTGGELLVDESLKTLEDEFADLFLRIHRNALVARSRLSGLEKTPEGGAAVRLRDCPERLTVSRRHLADIRRWLRAGTPGVWH